MAHSTRARVSRRKQASPRSSSPVLPIPTPINTQQEQQPLKPRKRTAAAILAEETNALLQQSPAKRLRKAAGSYKALAGAEVNLDGEPTKKPTRSTDPSAAPERSSRRYVKAKRGAAATPTSSVTDMEMDTDGGRTGAAAAANPAAEISCPQQQSSPKRMRKADGAYTQLPAADVDLDGERPRKTTKAASKPSTTVRSSRRCLKAKRKGAADQSPPATASNTEADEGSAEAAAAAAIPAAEVSAPAQLTSAERLPKAEGAYIQLSQAEVDLDGERPRRTTKAASEPSTTVRPSRRCVKAKPSGAAGLAPPATAPEKTTDEGSADAAAAAIPAAEVSVPPQPPSPECLPKAEGGHIKLPEPAVNLGGECPKRVTRSISPPSVTETPKTSAPSVAEPTKRATSTVSATSKTEAPKRATKATTAPAVAERPKRAATSTPAPSVAAAPRRVTRSASAAAMTEAPKEDSISTAAPPATKAPKGAARSASAPALAEAPRRPTRAAIPSSATEAPRRVTRSTSAPAVAEAAPQKATRGATPPPVAEAPKSAPAEAQAPKMVAKTTSAPAIAERPKRAPKSTRAAAGPEAPASAPAVAEAPKMVAKTASAPAIAERPRRAARATAPPTAPVRKQALPESASTAAVHVAEAHKNAPAAVEVPTRVIKPISAPLAAEAPKNAPAVAEAPKQPAQATRATGPPAAPVRSSRRCAKAEKGRAAAPTASAAATEVATDDDSNDVTGAALGLMSLSSSSSSSAGSAVQGLDYESDARSCRDPSACSNERRPPLAGDRSPDILSRQEKCLSSALLDFYFQMNFTWRLALRVQEA